MSEEIKNEFEGFISTLTKEICKEVLLEELKSINTSFDKSITKYNELNKENFLIIDKIKDESCKLKNVKKDFQNIINIINDNNHNMNEGLTIINKDRKKFIEDFTLNSNKLFEKYNKDIEALNVNERKVFIDSINSQIDKNTKKYVEDLNEAINGTKIEETLKSLDEACQKMLSTQYQITVSTNTISKIEREISDRVEKQVEKILSNKINEINKDGQQIFKNIQCIQDKIEQDNAKNIESLNNLYANISNQIYSLNKSFNTKNNIVIVFFIIIMILLFF